jgi:hypothetical protein
MAAPATAASPTTSTSQPDPPGDVQPTQDDRADITNFSLSYGPSSIDASIDVAQGSDPTSADWAGDTGAFWPIDVDGDNNPDFLVALTQNPDTGQPIGGVIDSNQGVACLAMVNWDGTNRYRVSFSPDCIGSPASIGVAAVFSYDTAPADTTNNPFSDIAPDSAGSDTPILAGPIDKSPSNGWAPFEPRFGSPQGVDGAPDAAAWKPGRLDVFARNGDGQLVHSFYDGGAWGSTEALGGAIAPGAGPAVAAWGPNRLDVFVTGTDHQLWHAWWDGAHWNGFEPLGGAIVGGPDAAAWSAGRLDVFVRGGDNQLWHKWYDGTRWNGFEPLGGQLAGAPDVSSWAPGRLDVFGRGGGTQLWHNSFQGNWNGWEPLGGVLTSDPGATSWAPGRIDVFGISGDGIVWHNFFP